MKVIFLKDVKNAGKMNEVREVADGFARNFLIPKKLAIFANQESIKNIENIRIKHAGEEEKKKADLIKTCKELENRELPILVKEKNGKLFGSISAKDIALELKKQGIEIPQKSIMLKEAIRKTGKHKIIVELGRDIQAHLMLHVSGEKS